MKVYMLSEEEKKEFDNKLDAILKLQKQYMHGNQPDEWISNRDFIKMMKISSRTAQNWRDQGIIEYHKVGEKLFYSRAGIQKMMDERKFKTFK